MNILNSITLADSAAPGPTSGDSGLGPPRRDTPSPGFGRFNPIGIINEIYIGLWE